MSSLLIHKAANSIDFLQKSIDKKVQSVEGDLHLTKDKIPVFFDNYFIEIKDKIFLIKDLSLDDLLKMKKRVGSRRVPLLLIDAIKLCEISEISLVIDVKSGPIYHSEFSDIIIKYLNNFKHKKDIYIMSYDHSIIQTLKNNASFCHKAGLLFSAKLVNLREVIRLTNSDFFQTNNFFLTKEEIKIAQEEAQEIIGWCSSDFEEIKLNIKRKLDFITIDFSFFDKCHSYLNQINKKSEKE